MSEWQPIETAPKDGSPVWVRGNNYGNPINGIHCCWAWFDKQGWNSSDLEPSRLLYLTHWMPLPNPPKD